MRLFAIWTGSGEFLRLIRLINTEEWLKKTAVFPLYLSGILQVALKLLVQTKFQTWPPCKSCFSCRWTRWTSWRRCRVRSRARARRRTRAPCWPLTAGSRHGTMPCSLMSCATSDLEAPEEEEEEEEEEVVETRRNEHHWRKVVEVAAVSKLNLCGRIIQENPDLFSHFMLQLYLRAFSCFIFHGRL